MSENVLGKREIIKLNEESAFGTLATGNYMVLNNAVFTPNNTQEFEVIKGKGTDSVVSSREAGVQDVNFTLEFSPRDWRTLVFATGDSTNVDKTTYYEHTISRNSDISVPSFSLQRVSSLSGGNLVRTYLGSKCNKYTLSWNTQGAGVGKMIKIVMECTASELVTDESEATGETVNANFVFQSRQVNLILDNTSFAESYSGSFVINTNLNDGWKINDNNRTETNPQEFLFNGTAIGDITGNEYFTLWSAGAAISDCSLVFTRGSNDDCTITFTNLTMNTAPDPTNLTGVNAVTLNFDVEDVAIVANDDRSDY